LNLSRTWFQLGDFDLAASLGPTNDNRYAVEQMTYILAFSQNSRFDEAVIGPAENEKP